MKETKRVRELKAMVRGFKKLLKLGSDMESYKKNYEKIFQISISDYMKGNAFAPPIDLVDVDLYYKEQYKDFKKTMEERLKTFSDFLLRAEGKELSDEKK